MRILSTVALGLTIAGIGFVPPAGAQHAGTAFITAFDTDHDGQLTRAEYDAARGVRFAATDTNGDGWISEGEYLAEYTARLEQQLTASTDTAEQKTEDRQRQTRQAHVRFGVLDADKDARITRAEYDRVGTRSFVEQDTDGDGVVTAEDVKAHKPRGRATQ